MKEVELERAQSLNFAMAMPKELAFWKAFHVYNLVEDMGQRAISCHWALVDNMQDDMSLKPKAPLVASGFQEVGVQNVLQVIFALAARCRVLSWLGSHCRRYLNGLCSRHSPGLRIVCEASTENARAAEVVEPA